MRTYRSTIWAACGAALLIVAAMLAQVLAGQEYTAKQLLAKWAEATGGQERLAKIENRHTQSTIIASGLEGTVEVWSTAKGETRTELDLGGLFGQTTVLDGQQGWMLDHNGKLQALQGTDLEGERTTAYFASLSHLVPGRLPGKAVAKGMDVAGENYVLAITPEGGRSVTVYLDAKTFLPSRQEQQDEDRIETSHLSDWRETDGVKMPHAVRVTSGDPRYDVNLTIESVEFNGTLTGDEFAEPGEGPKDYRFTAGESARDIPFELNSNHIYVQSRINGTGPLWLILDTGAGATVLNSARAEALGLKMEGRLEGRGAGSESVDVSVMPGASCELPGVELQDQTLMGIPLTKLEPYEGRVIDGILGYDLISRFVLEIDYARRVIHLYDPESYAYTGKGERVPLVLEGNIPQVMATVSVAGKPPVAAKFTIDTGARTALDLSRPFCLANGFPGGIETLSGGHGAGIGGETEQVIGRVTTLQLGSFELSDVVSGFSQDEGGALASEESAGLIGGEVLRRFNVIFDYSRSEMILEPNADFGAPFEYDMFGAYIVTEPTDFRRFVVHRLVAGAPAEAAGLKEGDIIISIDGRPSADYTLEELRGLFRDAGRECVLGIEDGDEVRTVTLKMKRMI